MRPMWRVAVWTNGSAGAADGLFDAFLSGSFTAPAQRRLNRNCVKCELTEQDNGLNMSAWYRVD
jgi:hypothetical protein